MSEAILDFGFRIAERMGVPRSPRPHHFFSFLGRPPLAPFFLAAAAFALLVALPPRRPINAAALFGIAAYLEEPIRSLSEQVPSVRRNISPETVLQWLRDPSEDGISSRWIIAEGKLVRAPNDALHDPFGFAPPRVWLHFSKCVPRNHYLAARLQFHDCVSQFACGDLHGVTETEALGFCKRKGWA